MNKTWFITGASRGFGRIWAEVALERGRTFRMQHRASPQKAHLHRSG